MSTYREYLVSRLNTIKNEHDKNSMLVIKGFAEYSLAIIADWAGENGCECIIPSLPLDADSLFENAKNFLVQLITSKAPVIVCLYEQYLSVADMLNTDVPLTDRNIVIIDNNLFFGMYPSVIAESLKPVLYRYFESDERSIPQEIEACTHFYSDCEILCGDVYGIKYIEKPADKHYSVVSVFERSDAEPSANSYPEQEIEIFSSEMQQCIIEVQNGIVCSDVSIVCNENTDGVQLAEPFVSLLRYIGVNAVIKLYDAFESINKQTRTFLPVLKRLHGENAAFRMLNFYKSPQKSNETIEISQDAVIADIVSQCEKAISGDKMYKNYFITAPTGAGKSLLFQLPAIYLAEEHKAVTIVVSPLIALMRDQVESLEKKGVAHAAFLNSSLSYSEREHISAQIKSGEKSIVYLAPELLLSCPLNTLLGDRKLGLFVVDEAHTVTSWGRDFRVDYWFLGDYLAGARRSGYNCPVLCLTATAVYGGKDDVVSETEKALGMQRTQIMLGDVKRKNITFDIRRFEIGDKKGSFEDLKLEHTARAIEEYTDKDEKTLVYCPYTTQVGEITRRVSSSYADKVAMYHGKLTNNQKIIYQDAFAAGKRKVMICTKAYGMGIDVKDIKNCYHFAPTGNLADYIQEIGRIARDPDIQGTARIDYSPIDIKYIRILYGLSRLKQFQLKEIMRKVYNIYAVKNHRNLIISPEVFGYLFTEDDIDNKVKNGLLLIEKDLESKYGFPVIKVRPKNMFTKSFVCVSPEIENRFAKKYAPFIRKVAERTSSEKGSYNVFNNTTTFDVGNIYEVDMAQIWEQEFSELTFADFKRKFFEGSLFASGTAKNFWPRVRLTIKYKRSFEEVTALTEILLDKLIQTFGQLKEEKGMFEYERFEELFFELAQGFPINIAKEYLKLIFEMFVIEVNANSAVRRQTDKLSFLQCKSGSHAGDSKVYRVVGNNYYYLKKNFIRILTEYKPWGENNSYVSYVLPQSEGSRSNVSKILSMLELLDLASYEIKGGTKVEIFIRINDPVKLSYLANGKYSNAILSELAKRQKDATQLVNDFFTADMTSDERWQMIENYFLGR